MFIGKSVASGIVAAVCEHDQVVATRRRKIGRSIWPKAKGTG